MLRIHTIEYHIPWEDLVVGASFWIPCLDCDLAETLVREDAECRRRKMRLHVKIVNEEGIRGIRVWRLRSSR